MATVLLPSNYCCFTTELFGHNPSDFKPITVNHLGCQGCTTLVTLTGRAVVILNCLSLEFKVN